MSQYMKAAGLAALVALVVFVACEQISQPNAPDSRSASGGNVNEKTLVVPGNAGPAPVTSGGPPVGIPSSGGSPVAIPGSGGGGGGSTPVAIPSGGSKNPVAIPNGGGGGGGGSPSPTPIPSGSPTGSPGPTPTPSGTPQPGSATFTNNTPIGPNVGAPTVQFVTVSGIPAGAQIVSARVRVFATIPDDTVVTSMLLSVNQAGDTVYDNTLTTPLAGADLGTGCITSVGFDDAFTNTFPGTASAPYVGNFKPQNPISSLFTAANMNPNTAWTLGIGQNGSTIIIKCLSLTLSWQ